MTSIAREKISKKFSLIELIMAFHTLAEISQEKTSAKGKFWFGVLFRRLAEIEENYREKELQIVRTYGVLDKGKYLPKTTDDGEPIPNSIQLSSDGEKELSELRKEEIIFDFYPLRETDFNDVVCSIEHIARLENFIVLSGEETHEQGIA
jgi:hypothetical protein